MAQDVDDAAIFMDHLSIEANISSDEEPISLRDSTRSNIRQPPSFSNTYPRGELSANFEPDYQQRVLHPHTSYASLDVDGGSGLYSRTDPGPDVPFTSLPIQNQQRTEPELSVEESSPNGSPGRKFEECVPNTQLQPDRPRFRSRTYQTSNIDPNTEKGRLASYHVYGWASTIDKTVLAKAGFFFEGYADEVVCAGCGGSLSNWQEGDNPIEEHRRNFGSVCFV